MAASSAAVSTAAVLVARRLRNPHDSGLDHALTVAVLLATAILVVSLAVGIVGLYRPLPLLGAAVVLALLAARLTRGARDAGDAAGVGDGRDGRRGVREALGSLTQSARREPVAAVAVVLAAGAVLHRALFALLLPPERFDALAYHLVFVGDWVQRGAIGGSELQRAGCCAWYPANAEVAYGWLGVFIHSDRLVGLGQIGFLIVGGLATASIARSVGAADPHCAIAGSLFVLTPVALRQANTNMNDVALAASVLVTVAFMLRIATTGGTATRADVVRFALAAAVTLGIKATAIPYVAVACGALASCALLARRRAASRPSWRPIALAGALIFVLALLGSGWYVRAWAATGNPFWPYRLEALGHVVFAGPRDPVDVNPTPPPLAGIPSALHAPRSWLEDLDVSTNLRFDPAGTNPRLGGLGLVWLLVGIPGALAALFLSLRRRDSRFALVALAIVPVALFATPNPWFARFTIPIAAVGLVGFAYAVGRLPSPFSRAITAGAIALSVVGVIETRPLAGIDRLRNTPGVPRARPLPWPDYRGYSSLVSIPPQARVAVGPGSPLLPYLVMGGQYGRTVVPLRERPDSAEELGRFVAAHELDYLVTRDPLPRQLLDGGALGLVAHSSGAVVYRRTDAPLRGSASSRTGASAARTGFRPSRLRSDAKAGAAWG
jgi:hypothetical protein